MGFFEIPLFYRAKNIAKVRMLWYPVGEVMHGMSQTLFHCSEADFKISHTRTEHPEDSQEMHTHSHYEIYYFISGMCHYLVEGTRYSLKPGDIMIMRPFESHKCVALSPDVPYERIVCNVTEKFILQLTGNDSLLRTFRSRPLGVANRFSDLDFGHTLCSDSFQTMIQREPNISRDELIARLFLILCEAKRVTETANTHTRAESIASQIIDYVNSNLYTPLSLETLSKEFFLSRSQINRIFKDNTGSSVGRYVAIKRLLSARQLIRSGDAVAAAAAKCGYGDYSAFYRAYIKQFGVSPQKDRG